MALKRCLQATGLRRRQTRREYRKKRTTHPLGWYLVYPLKLVAMIAGLIICVIVETVRLLPVWIYELFRFCPLRGQGAAPADDFLIIGHRGAAADAVENTLKSFRLAVEEQQANGIEMDLSMTSDKQLVAWHDWDPDNFVALVRQAGLEPSAKYRPFIPQNGPMRRRVSSLTLTELHAHYGYAKKEAPARRIDAEIPTLNEIFEWTAGQPGVKAILLDIKIPDDEPAAVPDFMRELKKVIDRHPQTAQLLLLTPSDQVLSWMKEAAPELHYSYDLELPPVLLLDPGSFSSVKKAIEWENNSASVGRPAVSLGPWTGYRRVVENDMKLIHTNSLVKRLIGWTINRRREMRCLMRMGVTGILTDHPALLRQEYQKLISAGK